MTIGSVLVLLAPLILILSAQIWAHSFKSAGVVLFHAWLARISVGIVALLAITGLGCALRSIRLVDYFKLPAGCAVAGLVSSLSACTLWVATALALLNTTESLLILYT